MTIAQEQIDADIAEGLIPIDTDVNAAMLVAQYRAARTAKQDAEAKLETLKEQLGTYIVGHGGVALTMGGHVVARRTSGTNHGVDSRALKKDFPDIHAQYLRTTAYTRITVTDSRD